MSEFTREQDVLISVYYSLVKLNEQGFVEGGTHRLTMGGIERAKHLLEIGFQPTGKEMKNALHAIQSAEKDMTDKW